MNYALIMLSWGIWCTCYTPHELAVYPTKALCEEARKQVMAETLIGISKSHGNFVCGAKQ